MMDWMKELEHYGKMLTCDTFTECAGTIVMIRHYAFDGNIYYTMMRAGKVVKIKYIGKTLDKDANIPVSNMLPYNPACGSDW